MAIPTSQLDIWRKQGATTTSSQIYASVQACLNADVSKISSLDYEIFLQGSYKNDTNIYADSDVDVVVQLKTTWNRDISQLSSDETQRYLATYPNATYLWEHFYRDVLATLSAYYKEPVSTSGKVPKIKTMGGYTADIVIATDYRRYTNFQSDRINKYVEGTKFIVPNGGNREVINYPKIHYENGVSKNGASSTNGWYKPTVRMFKNIRNKMIDDGKITSKLAPSYFLECLIYNVPDSCFSSDAVKTFCDVINHLHAAVLTKYVCQNHQLYLFGSAQEQWNEADAKSFISQAIDLWNKWT